MSNKGNIQLTFIFTAPPELVETGDRLFESHAKWMAESHHRSGEFALLRYNVVKGSEITTALDPSSDPTGNTSYLLMEVYKSPAGLADHWKKAAGEWKDFGKLMEWASKIKVEVIHDAEVIHSLW